MTAKAAIKGVYYYLIGRAVAKLHYSERYISGRYFEGAGGLRSMFAAGWEWCARDYRANRRLGINQAVKWPVSPRCTVIFPENIEFHPDNIDNFQSPGCYYQGMGRIRIGRGSYIAPNVGIITANHDPANPDLHLPPRPVSIGKKCWIGMNSMILPGVVLGDHTVVGAGSVVTRSFPEGHCVVAGNPARKLQTLAVNKDCAEEANNNE